MSVEDLSDEELLDRIADLDPDTYPLAELVRERQQRRITLDENEDGRDPS